MGGDWHRSQEDSSFSVEKKAKRTFFSLAAPKEEGGLTGRASLPFFRATRLDIDKSFLLLL
jgi:hypothetical protein